MISFPSHGSHYSIRADGNTEPDDDLMDYMLLLTAHVSAMYKAIIKPARNTNGWQQASSSRLLAEVR